MTGATARTVANVVLISAGVAAAYVVVTTPPLRRLALRGTEWWLGATVPGYLLYSQAGRGRSRHGPSRSRRSSKRDVRSEGGLVRRSSVTRRCTPDVTRSEGGR